MEKDCLNRHIWSYTKTQNIEIMSVKCKRNFDMSPGCGGIRRHVEEFQQKGFIELFISAIMLRKGKSLNDSTWVVGGDGRYYSKEAIYRVVGVMAGHKVQKIVTAKDGIMTTPAMCLMVTTVGAMGGIFLTAGHMPAGPGGYFGIKYLIEDGGVASDEVLKNIHDIAKVQNSYLYASGIKFPLHELNYFSYGVDDMVLSIRVMNAVRIYADYMKTIFDYERINDLLTGDQIVSTPLRVLVDCMNGASGSFAKEVLEHDLRAAPGTVMNSEPEEIYVSGYPSPRNSKALVQALRTGVQEVGFGLDVDGGRVMVMGKRAHPVYPSDSVAILAEHLHCIPYFQLNGVIGYARTFPTSKALDGIAEGRMKPVYEVPLGWVYFSNLIRNKSISFCGDSNYGLGSSHLLENDAIWGTLAWLSVIHHMRMSVRSILHYHWRKFGRYFTARMVYENIDREVFSSMIDYLEFVVTRELFVASQHGSRPFVYTVLTAENFKYKDPVDNVIRKTGITITFHPNSRITYRVGIGKQNRLKIYLESFSTDSSEFESEPVAYLRPLSLLAVQLANISHFFNDITPTYML